MAQSRLEKIGTIFSRLQGLRKSGAIKAEQVPIWAEVYEAFPPRYEPRWDAKDPVIPVRKILYREDSVRAQYSKFTLAHNESYPGKCISSVASKVFGANERIDLFSDTKLESERFVEKFLAIHDSGEVAPDQVWERTVQAFELEGVQIGGVDGKSKSDESIVTQEKQTEKIPPKPSVSFEDLFSKES